MRTLPSGACLGLLPLFAACSQVDDPPAHTAVTDSAGIQIVTNAAPATAPLRTVSAPVLEIGRVTDGGDYELYDVGGVARSASGGIAVAIGGTEIRWFDAEGRFRSRSGRDGGGPGEFRRIRYIRSLAGDSLLVFDSGNRRVSIIDPDGSYARGESIGLDDERPVTVAAALSDGTLLTRTALETPRATTRLYRTPLGFVVNRRGTVVPLPTYPGPEAALHVEGSGGDVGSIFISVLPFARAAYATGGPRHFFVGSSDTYQIDVWNETGQLVRIIRATSPVTPVTDDVRQEYVSVELERMRVRATQRGRPFDEAQARRQLNDQAHAPALPAYSALLAGADGGLWVRDYALPGVEPAPEHWTIFDDAGHLAARVVLPAGFTPLHVDAELVLGVFRDSLDVPYVRGYVVRQGSAN